MQDTVICIVFRILIPLATWLICCRLKSSTGVSGINRLESSFEPESPRMGGVSRNELETVSIARDRSVLAEQRLMDKGNNK